MTERRWELVEDRKPLTRKQVAALFLRQDGRCALCSQKLETKGHVPVNFIDEHLKPLSMLGTNDLENRALVCKPCARSKTDTETPIRAKAYRQRDRAIGALKPSGRPLAGSKRSGWKCRLGPNGKEWVKR
jgi:5-methylcytosine-specific restriction endonuclease McrA